MFHIMKVYITENKANRKFITEKENSGKFFPDFPDIKSKFPDNSLIFSVKKVHFQIPWQFSDFPDFQVGCEPWQCAPCFIW